MDPISATMFLALASGVAEGLGEMGKGVIVNAYNALTDAIKQVCGADSEVVEAIGKVEQRPDSQPRKGMLQEEIATAKLQENPEIMALTQQLLEAIRNTPQKATGVDLKDIEAIDVTIKRVRTTGIGVRAENVKLTGRMDISDIEAGVFPPKA